jgi:putative spermidine/putrescine transport system ATP-binding protein
VALARAIVFQPRLLLMDEPLGALDRKLREVLQLEILAIRRRIGVTVVYVTHDQEEALAMSDRIAIFNNGRIDQIGTAEDLYVDPATLFVATFVGESTIIPGRYERNGGAEVVGELGRWPLATKRSFAAGEHVGIVIRPERLAIRSLEDAADLPGVEGTIAESLYLGSTRRYDLALADGTKAVVREQTTGDAERRTIGDRVRLTWRPEDATAVPLGTEPEHRTEESDVAES